MAEEAVSAVTAVAGVADVDVDVDASETAAVTADAIGAVMTGAPAELVARMLANTATPRPVPTAPTRITATAKRLRYEVIPISPHSHMGDH